MGHGRQKKLAKLLGTCLSPWGAPWHVERLFPGAAHALRMHEEGQRARRVEWPEEEGLLEPLLAVGEGAAPDGQAPSPGPGQTAASGRQETVLHHLGSPGAQRSADIQNPCVD